MRLSMEECEMLYGRAAPANNLFLYFIVSCGIVAFLKMLLSRRGRISFAGISLQWGK